MGAAGDKRGQELPHAAERRKMGDRRRMVAIHLSPCRNGRRITGSATLVWCSYLSHQLRLPQRQKGTETTNRGHSHAHSGSPCLSAMPMGEGCCHHRCVPMCSGWSGEERINCWLQPHERTLYVFLLSFSKLVPEVARLEVAAGGPATNRPPRMGQRTPGTAGVGATLPSRCRIAGSERQGKIFQAGTLPQSRLKGHGPSR